MGDMPDHPVQEVESVSAASLFIKLLLGREILEHHDTPDTWRCSSKIW